MKRFLKLSLIMVWVIFAASSLMAGVVEPVATEGQLHALEKAKSQLYLLKAELMQGSEPKVIVKVGRNFQLQDSYRTGELRQTARELQQYESTLSDTIGFAIAEICGRTARNTWSTQDIERFARELISAIDGVLAKLDKLYDEQRKIAEETDSGDEEVPAQVPVPRRNPGHDQQTEAEALEDNTISMLGQVAESANNEDDDEDEDDDDEEDDDEDDKVKAYENHGSNTYTVKSGDSVWKIAQRFAGELGMPAEDLVKRIIEINLLGKKAVIHPGQELDLPGAATSEAALGTGTVTRSVADDNAVGTSINDTDYAEKVIEELRESLREAHGQFVKYGGKFRMAQYGSEDDKIEAVHEVRSTASNYVVWARRRYQTLKDQIRKMQRCAKKDEAVSFLKRLATVGRAADNLQYAKTSGWRFEYCNQQVLDLLIAANV